MKSTLCFLLGLLVPTGLLLGEEPAPLTDEMLSRLRAEAVRNHPSVDSAKLKATAAIQDIRSVRLWDDPMAGLMLMGAEKMMREDDGDIRLSQCRRPARLP